MWIRRSPEALLALLLIQSAANAFAADGTLAERARIARERAAVEAQARSAEQDCAQRFAVSSCVAQVRAERRSKVQSLDRQNTLLDEAQRRDRAAERLERLHQRQGAASAVPSIVPAPARVEPRPPAASEPAAEAAANAATRQASAAARSEAEQRDAAKRAAANARRARDAQSHREAVEQRNRERILTRKPSVPLPPGGAPASSPR